MADNIGSVSVEVVPDARGFAEKLKAKLRDIEVKVGVNLDDARARAQLDKLAMAKRSVTIKADADTKLARAQLDRLGKNRTAKIRAVVDRSAFRQAESGAAGAAGGMRGMAAAALALGPALIPATAAVAGFAGALAAPLVAGGVGAGIFGGFAVAAIAKAAKDAKAANGDLSGLSKGEREFIKASRGIRTAFNTVLSHSDLFTPLTGGANLLAKVLPKLTPVVNAFGHEFTRLEGGLSRFADSRSFTSFINYLDTKGVRSLDSLAHIAGHVALGVGSMVNAMTPLSGGVLDKINRGLQGFDHVGQSRGFQNFLSYVREVGPKVGHTLADIGGAALHMARVLAPQGAVVLDFADKIARLVRNAKPGQLAAIAGGIGAIGIATGRLGKLASISLLMTALSYANKHSTVFHTLAQGAGQLASALGKLPGGVQALGIIAGIGAARKFNIGGSVGKPGGVVSKVLGGGVQKVFVVNMPHGGLPGTPGSKGPGTPPIVPAAPFSLSAFANVGITTAGLAAIVKITNALNDKFVHARLQTRGLTADLRRYGDTGRAGGQLTKTFGDNLGSLSKRAHEFSGASGKINRSMLWLERLEPGRHSMNDANKAFQNIDRSLAKLSHRNPGSALSAYHRILQKTGLSASEAAKLFPKATRALADLQRKTSLVHAEKLAHDFTTGASKAIILSNALRKTGISTSEYHKKLSTLPSQVATKVTTPGMVTSRKQAIALGHQYGLTPKQIRTLVQLAGVNAAVTAAARARAALASITDRTVYIHVKTTGPFGKLNPTAAKPRGAFQAAGGLTQRVPTLVGEFGPELIEPSGPSFVHTAAATRELSNSGRASGSTFPDSLNLVVDGEPMAAWFERSYDGQKAFDRA